MRAGLGTWSALLSPEGNSLWCSTSHGQLQGLLVSALSCTGLCLTLNSPFPFMKKLHSTIKGRLTDHAPPHPTLQPCPSADAGWAMPLLLTSVMSGGGGSSAYPA